jgi:hypothetical protein
MANISRPMGFRPAKSLLGAPWTGLIRFYNAANRAADTTNNHGDIYIGDPVKLVAGAVLPANSNDIVLGVCVATGVTTNSFGQTGYFNPNNLGQRYLGAADVGVVGVVPAEGVLFEIESASDLDLVQGSVADFNLVAAVAHGSRLTGYSNVRLVTSVNSDVQVVENVTSPNNDFAPANDTTAAKYLVMFKKIQDTF